MTDLLTTCVEAGLGLDAALMRVARGRENVSDLLAEARARARAALRPAEAAA
jgi:pilus assembly protein TadC